MKHIKNSVLPKKLIRQRLLSLVLTFAMIAGLLPVFSLPVSAAEEPEDFGYVDEIDEIEIFDEENEEDEETRDLSYTSSSETIIAQGNDAGPNVSWVLYDDGMLEISGTGDMYDWTSSFNVPWLYYEHQQNIKTVIISDEVTSIGSLAFFGCNNLVNINMPNVTNIGDRAFMGCTNLTNINTPNVINIREQAFMNCINLTNINMPNAKNIEHMAFAYCTELTNVDMPKVENISGSFYECNNLYNVYFGLKTPPIVDFEPFRYVAPDARAIVPLDGTWPAEGTLWNGLIIVYAETSTPTINNFTQLQTAVNNFNTNATEDTTILIGSDFDIEASLVISNPTYTLTIKSDETIRTLTRGFSDADYLNGLLYVASGASLVIEDIIIDGNKEVYANNRASLIFNSGIFTMNNGAVLQNNTVDDLSDEFYTNDGGGGVFNSFTGTFIMNGGKIRNNTANDGGGVASWGTFTMNGGEIKENNARFYAGGVLNHDDFNMNGGYISDNIGNGVSHANFYQRGTFTLEGGIISGNTGDGVAVGNSPFIMNGGEICDNTGAGVVNFNAFTMNSGKINGNANGGVSNDGTFTMDGGEIKENTGSHGGGVSNGETFIMNNGEINENTSSSYGGGGVYNSSTFTMNGGTIKGNNSIATSSTLGGGGVLNANIFTMNDGEISGNSANSNGGGLYLRSGTFTMSGGKINGNISGVSGGGAYFDAGEFNMSGGEIKGNTAGISSGIHWRGDTIRLTGSPVIGTISDNNAITRVYFTQFVRIEQTGLSAGAYINIDSFVSDVPGRVIATKQDGSLLTPAEVAAFHYLGDSFICIANGADVVLLSVIATICDICGEDPCVCSVIIASGECGDDLTWTLDEEGLLTISGTGNMWNWDNNLLNHAPWYDHRIAIKNIDISIGTTSIGNDAFVGHIYSYGYTNLMSVNMPNVTTIGSYAFSGCTNLKDVYMPKVESIGSSAFNYCENLNIINIPNVKSIGYSAFYMCTNLTSINISNVISIAMYAFRGCNKLTSVDIIDLKNIGEGAFFGCTNLTGLNMSNVTSIENEAFWNCNKLYDVYFETTTPPTVGTNAFQNVAPGARAIVPPNGTWPAEGTLWNGLIIVYAETSTPTINNFTQLQTAVNNFNTNATENTTIFIGADFDIEESLVVSNPTYTLTIKSDESIRTLTRGYNSSSYGSGMFSLFSEAKLIFENIIIDGAKGVYTANRESLVMIRPNCALIIKSEAVLQNSRSMYGAVLIRGGEFTMDGGKISSNTAGDGGGVSMFDETLYSAGGNSTAYGSFIMNDGEISGNEASNGGGVYISGGTFIMYGGNIIENNATNAAGGVNISGSISSFTLNNGKISDNTASTGGGVGSYAAGSTFNINGGEISSNNATNIGGGVYFTNTSGKHTMTGGAVFGNTAKVGNGLAFNSSGWIEISGAPIVGTAYDGNTIEQTTSTPYRINIEIAETGLSEDAHINLAPHSNDAPDTVVAKKMNGTVTLVEAQAFNYMGNYLECVVDADGENVVLAITAEVPDIVVNFPQLVAAINDFNKNALADTTILIGADFDIETNLIITNKNYTLTVKSHGITRALTRAFNGSRVFVIDSNAKLTIEDIIIDGNKDVGLIGGLVSCELGGVFTMNNGAVLQNGLDRDGGGLHIYYSTFIMNGGKITGNSATSYGGGVYKTGGELIMNGGEIAGNSAAYFGGGVYNNSNPFTMYGGVIEANDAVTGGGIYTGGSGDSRSATVIMAGGKVTGNTATNGAGIYLAYLPSISLEVSGSPVIGTATDGNAVTRAAATQIINIRENGLSGSAHINIEAHIEDETETVIASKQAGTLLTDAEAEAFNYLGNFITVADGMNVILAEIPIIEITTQPEPVTDVTLGNISGSLSVTANVTQGATLNYQWYSNISNSNENGTLVVGATDSNFIIPTELEEGIYYYYCIISTNIGAVSEVSDVATLNVKPVQIILENITITTPPAKTIYTQGETLDLDGLTVTAVYSDGSTQAVTDFTTTPANGTELDNTGTQTVTVTYTENGVTKSVDFNVTVNVKITLCDICGEDPCICSNLIDNMRITASPKTRAAVFYAVFGADAAIADKNGVLLASSDYVGTGAVITIAATGAEITIIVYGDLTGSGYVGMDSIVVLARHIAALERIDEVFIEAADVNGDNRVNIADLIRLARYHAEVDTSPLG